MDSRLNSVYLYIKALQIRWYEWKLRVKSFRIKVITAQKSLGLILVMSLVGVIGVIHASVDMHEETTYRPILLLHRMILTN